MKLFLNISLVGMGLCLGCSTPSSVSSCQGTDWFELGRRDGVAGNPSPERMDSHRRDCGKDFIGESEVLYVNGYNKGLVEYCSFENGYLIGRNGRMAAAVCPRPLDEAFLAGVDMGKRLSTLEQANARLDRRISSVNQRLKSQVLPPAQREALNNELNGLKAERNQIERKINSLEKQTTKNL